MLNNEEIARLFIVDPERGKVFWRRKVHARGGKLPAGSEAGCLIDTKQWKIGVAGKSFPRSRIIYQFVHGPKATPPRLRHRNGITTDDRISNLAPETREDLLRHLSKIGAAYKKAMGWVTGHDKP